MTPRDGFLVGFIIVSVILQAECLVEDTPLAFPPQIIHFKEGSWSQDGQDIKFFLTSAEGQPPLSAKSLKYLKPQLNQLVNKAFKSLNNSKTTGDNNNKINHSMPSETSLKSSIVMPIKKCPPGKDCHLNPRSTVMTIQRVPIRIECAKGSNCKLTFWPHSESKIGTTPKPKPAKSKDEIEANQPSCINGRECLKNGTQIEKSKNNANNMTTVPVRNFVDTDVKIYVMNDQSGDHHLTDQLFRYLRPQLNLLVNKAIKALYSYKIISTPAKNILSLQMEQIQYNLTILDSSQIPSVEDLGPSYEETKLKSAIILPAKEKCQDLRKCKTTEKIPVTLECFKKMTCLLTFWPEDSKAHTNKTTSIEKVDNTTEPSGSQDMIIPGPQRENVTGQLDENVKNKTDDASHKNETFMKSPEIIQNNTEPVVTPINKTQDALIEINQNITQPSGVTNMTTDIQPTENISGQLNVTNDKLVNDGCLNGTCEIIIPKNETHLEATEIIINTTEPILSTNMTTYVPPTEIITDQLNGTSDILVTDGCLNGTCDEVEMAKNETHKEPIETKQNTTQLIVSTDMTTDAPPTENIIDQLNGTSGTLVTDGCLNATCDEVEMAKNETHKEPIEIKQNTTELIVSTDIITDVPPIENITDQLKGTNDTIVTDEEGSFSNKTLLVTEKPNETEKIEVIDVVIAIPKNETSELQNNETVHEPTEMEVIIIDDGVNSIFDQKNATVEVSGEELEKDVDNIRTELLLAGCFNGTACAEIPMPDKEFFDEANVIMNETSTAIETVIEKPNNHNQWNQNQWNPTTTKVYPESSTWGGQYNHELWGWKPQTANVGSNQWEWKPTTPKSNEVVTWGYNPNQWVWQAPTTTTTETTFIETSQIKEPLSGDFKVVCYFTNWAWYRPGVGKYTPSDIDPTICTHVVYGFATLDYSELVIKAYDSWADLDNEFYKKVTSLQRLGIKVSIAIGGWNDSEGDKYSRLVNNPAARKKFVDHVLQFITKHNFDGLDLDWEYPSCWQVECTEARRKDKASFAAWVHELKEAFRPKGLLLSAAVSPSKQVIDYGYDVPSIARDLDWIAVMTYDYHGHWDKKTGHVAPMYHHPDADYDYFNANFTMHYWIEKGAPREKLIMGMPLYGQAFTLDSASRTGFNSPASQKGTAGEYTRQAGFLAYYEICPKVKSGWTVVEDPEGRIGPYAYNGNQWVSYDNVKMIEQKSQYIRKMGLGGGMVWALDLDDFKNSCGEGFHPLMNTIKKVLGPRRTSTELASACAGRSDCLLSSLLIKKSNSSTCKNDRCLNRLPSKILGLYTLLADDSVDGYHADDDWNPKLHQYQQLGFNVLFFTAINPDTMIVPIAFQKLAATRGTSAIGAVPLKTQIIFVIGGSTYRFKYSSWSWLSSKQAAESMADEVATWPKRFGCDGVDLGILDEAGSVPESGSNLLHFIRRLKQLNPDFIIGQPAYGYSQVPAVTEVINNSWNANATSNNLIDYIGVMIYEETESLRYVSYYQKGKQQWDQFPITVTVPSKSILVGCKGTSSAKTILTLGQETLRRNLLGLMVKYASVRNGFHYEDNSWDASKSRESKKAYMQVMSKLKKNMKSRLH